jgi:hypothetical protein
MNISHTAGDRTPFTYLIGWSNLNTWYYGVRYGKSCHPSNLFTTYFTSSKHVKKFILKNGMPDVVQIRKIFNNIVDARKWEDKVIIRMKMTKLKKFLNRCSSKSISPEDAGKASRGKTYEEIYGIEIATELKKKRSLSSKSRTLPKWEERKNGREHGNKGIPSKTKGIPRTEEDKIKMRGKKSKKPICNQNA